MEVVPGPSDSQLVVTGQLSRAVTSLTCTQGPNTQKLLNIKADTNNTNPLCPSVSPPLSSFLFEELMMSPDD